MEGKHGNDESWTCLGWPSDTINDNGSYKSNSQTILQETSTVHGRNVGGRGRRRAFRAKLPWRRYLCREKGIRVRTLLLPVRLDSRIHAVGIQGFSTRFKHMGNAAVKL